MLKSKTAKVRAVSTTIGQLYNRLIDRKYTQFRWEWRVVTTKYLDSVRERLILWYQCPNDPHYLTQIGVKSVL